MVRILAIVVLLVLLLATVAYGNSMTGSAKPLGGGSGTVAHCQVVNYSIAALDTISSVNAQVKCDLTGSYNVTASVTSGVNSGTGQTAASLTANTAQSVAVTISPSVAISGSTYSADILVKR